MEPILFHMGIWHTQNYTSDPGTIDYLLLPHDAYMPKIYIIGGIIFIVTKYVHIYELYYNFYFIYFFIL